MASVTTANLFALILLVLSLTKVVMFVARPTFATGSEYLSKELCL